MYENTPNKEHLDLFVQRIREQYQFEKLKDWPLNRLEGEEWNLEIEFEMFRTEFPHSESVCQGDLRAYFSDNPNDTKEALTAAEMTRLRSVKKEAKGEINRAIGHRKLKRGEQRHELVNSATDFIDSLTRMVLSIRSTVSKLVPW